MRRSDWFRRSPACGPVAGALTSVAADGIAPAEDPDGDAVEIGSRPEVVDTVGFAVAGGWDSPLPLPRVGTSSNSSRSSSFAIRPFRSDGFCFGGEAGCPAATAGCWASFVAAGAAAAGSS